MPCPEPSFTADILHQDGSAVLLLTGELDIATTPILVQAIHEIAGPHLTTVTLDLRDLTFVDVAGLRTLLAAHQTATRAGAKSRLLSVDDLTRRVIRIVGFDELDAACETV